MVDLKVKAIDLSMYINGEWRKSQNEERRPVYNPATGEIITFAPEGNIGDAREAIDAARKAFDDGIWSDLPAAERAAYLFKIADKIEEY